MKTVVITGADGVIGSILTRELKQDFELAPLNHKNCDLTKWSAVQKSILNNTDVIIHLAWKAGDLYKDGHYDADNVLMTLNILEISAQKKIPRVILASSIHANEYRFEYLKTKMFVSGDLGGPSQTKQDTRRNILKLRNTTSSEYPTSIYGATKLYFEALGRYYALYRGVEVVAVRFGGVNLPNSPTARQEPDYEKIFLSHEDLVKIIKNLIKKDKIPGRYECIYAISEN